MPFRRSAQRSPAFFRGFKVKRLIQRFLGHAAMMMMRDGIETKLDQLNPKDPQLMLKDEAFFKYVYKTYLRKFDTPNNRY